MPINLDHSLNAINTPNGEISFSMTGALKAPSGTTAQRPIVPVAGMMRYNTTIGSLEVYTTTWEQINDFYTSADFDTDFSTKDTDNLSEGVTNLYYTTTRANTDIDARVTKSFVDALNIDADTLDGQQGTYYLDYTNFTNTPALYTSSDFDTDLAASTTDDLSEGVTNLYYTDARARSAFSATGDLSYNSVTGEFSVTTYKSSDFDTDFAAKDTDDLSEGATNLYFTDERVDDRVNDLLVAGTNITLTYNDVANTLTIDAAAGSGYTSTDFDNDFAAKDTDDLSEGAINLYYTTTRANTAIDTRVTKSFVDALNINADTLDGLDSTDFATAAQGSLADTALQDLSGKSTTDLAEGTNLYFTDERVDDRVNDLLVAGTNITLTYNDVANTLTIAATDTNTTYSAGNGISLSGTTFSVAGGAGLTQQASGLALNLSSLPDMTAAATGTDELIILDAGVQSRKAINEISLGLFNTANQIALGTDTTGNYVATISGTANEIEVTGSGSESAAVTIGLPDNVTIGDNLTITSETRANGGIRNISGTYQTIDSYLAVPKGYSGGGGLSFRFDDNQLSYIFDRFNLSYTMNEGTDPGAGSIHRLFTYTNAYINLNTLKSVSNNFEFEITGLSLSNSSNTWWAPMVLWHTGQTNVSNMVVEFREGDNTTWTEVFNGAPGAYTYPSNFTLFATGILTGVRFRFTGISGNAYLKMLGATSRTSDSFAWQMLKSGGSFYGDINGYEAGSLTWSISQATGNINTTGIYQVNGSQIDTNDVLEGSNLYYTDERVDDRVNALLVAGSNITLTYNDVANTLTIDADATGGYDLSNNNLTDVGDVSATGLGDANILIYDTSTTSWRPYALSGDATMTDTGVITVSNSATADTWTTARTLTLTGDVTGASAAFNGSGNITLSTTIAANSVALGTDTTGNYAASVAAGSGITVTGAAGEGTAFTVAHADTSAQASLTALTGANVVSDIDVDGFGHVTNLATRALTLANLGYTGDTNAQANQNAFSNIAVSSQSTVVADTTTDTLTLVAGSNVTITTNATTDTITIASTDTNTTYSAGNGISLSGTTFSVAAGSGLTQQASGLALNLSSLPDMTAAATGTDELIILDAGVQSRKAINEITLGLFNTANQIALGTDTTGSYVQQGATSGNGLSGSVNAEAGTFTVTSNATNANTANTIVYRDGSGNFSAGTITAALNGNATTSTTLQTARTIAGVSFNGSANINIPIGNLSDVTISSVATDEILQWNGSAWINQTFSEAGLQKAVTTSITAPSSPVDNDLWFNPENGGLYIRYTDITPDSYWVQIGGADGGGGSGSGSSPFVDTGSVVYYGGSLNVGIGTATPSQALEVIGNIEASEDVIAYSDERLKEEIKTIEGALDIVARMRGVTFKKRDSGRKSLGLIAQEVENVLPDIVHTNEETGMKSVAYGNIVGVLVEAIKEQDNKITQMQNELNEIRDMLKNDINMKRKQ